MFFLITVFVCIMNLDTSPCFASPIASFGRDGGNRKN